MHKHSLIIGCRNSVCGVRQMFYLEWSRQLIGILADKTTPYKTFDSRHKQNVCILWSHITILPSVTPAHGKCPTLIHQYSNLSEKKIYLSTVNGA